MSSFESKAAHYNSLPRCGFTWETKEPHKCSYPIGHLSRHRCFCGSVRPRAKSEAHGKTGTGSAPGGETDVRAVVALTSRPVAS